MALKIAGRLFTGPLPMAKARLRRNHDPAVFAIIAKGGEPWNPTFRLIAVGESADADVEFARHPDLGEWERHGNGELGVCLLQMPRAEADEAARRALVAEVKGQYDPPNGFVSITGGA